MACSARSSSAWSTTEVEEKLYAGPLRCNVEGADDATIGWLTTVLAAIETLHPREEWRGELGYLAAISPTVHRLVLELIDHQARALAEAIEEADGIPPPVARLQGTALSGVFAILIEEAGSRTRRGQSQSRIARELRPVLEGLLDELDRWFSSSEPSR